MTNNEQLKKSIRFGKFLPWNIWRNFIIVSGGSFNKRNWKLRSSSKWWELVLNTQVAAFLEMDVPPGCFKLCAFQLTKLPLSSGSLYSYD
jgi:hypothetical protein